MAIFTKSIFYVSFIPEIDNAAKIYCNFVIGFKGSFTRQSKLLS